jgi:long-chain acyl-CoA synthetase
MLLSDLIRRGAERHPDRPAIRFDGAVVTYGDLGCQVDRLARALHQRGVAAGDRVGLLLPNLPVTTVAYFGAVAAGAVVVPANPLLKAAELAHIWRDSDVRLVIAAPSLLETAREALASLTPPRTLVSIGEQRDTPEEVVAIGRLLAEGAEAPPPPSRAREDDPAVCLYTSGTTGKPKGALLSHRNLLANCRQIAGALRLTADDNVLCVLPLFHSFGATVCQNTPLYSGARLTLVETFHPARALEIIERARPTLFPGVPAMYAAILKTAPDRKADLSSLRACLSGGAPMPLAVMQAFEARFGAPILEGDGPTECSPATSINPLGGVRKCGTIGLPLHGIEMKIVGDDDRELSDGEVGEIVVRGENVMLGYHNQPEATAEAMRGGWYHTGDLGTRDGDGYFSIVDRKKDMLIVGGLNVYPREVEEVLYAHPAIADAAVIGAHDDLRGEVPMAVVALKPGVSAAAPELTSWCRERLANFKVPRKVLFRESLPRSATGKILKRLLRKELDLEGCVSGPRGPLRPPGA